MIILRRIGLLFMISFLFQTCIHLDEDPDQAVLVPGRYPTLEDLEMAVTGIYGKLVRTTWRNNFFINGWSGDDMTTANFSSISSYREFDQRVVHPDNPRSLYNWRAGFEIISLANIVINGAENLQLNDSQAQNRLIGETHFLRAFMYLHLTRIFGPLPLHLTSTPDFEIKRSTPLKVYQQIESDLLKAKALLPNIYPNVREGASRPNKGSASAFLARLYLDWAGFPVEDQSKYTLAASSAKTVIDNHEQHGFELVDDLEQIWTLAGRFNTESLFTMPYCVACNQPNMKYGKLGLPSSLGGWHETYGEIRFFEDFPEGPRKEATYRTELDWENFIAQASPIFKKIAGPASDSLSQFFRTDRNDFLMRYAEVLLIYAEASGRSGNVTADAWEALNQIRRRAEGLPFDTPNPMIDITSGDIAELAFEERKWEFAGEWLRWNDLVRMKKVEEALSNRNPQVSVDSIGNLLTVPNKILGSLDTDNYFAPIPRRVLEESPNLIFIE